MEKLDKIRLQPSILNIENNNPKKISVKVKFDQKMWIWRVRVKLKK